MLKLKYNLNASSNEQLIKLDDFYVSPDLAFISGTTEQINNCSVGNNLWIKSPYFPKELPEPVVSRQLVKRNGYVLTPLTLQVHKAKTVTGVDAGGLSITDDIYYVEHNGNTYYATVGGGVSYFIIDGEEYVNTNNITTIKNKSYIENDKVAVDGIVYNAFVNSNNELTVTDSIGVPYLFGDTWITSGVTSASTWVDKVVIGNNFEDTIECTNIGYYGHKAYIVYDGEKYYIQYFYDDEGSIEGAGVIIDGEKYACSALYIGNDSDFGETFNIYNINDYSRNDSGNAVMQIDDDEYIIYFEASQIENSGIIYIETKIGNLPILLNDRIIIKMNENSSELRVKYDDGNSPYIYLNGRRYDVIKDLCDCINLDGHEFDLSYSGSCTNVSVGTIATIAMSDGTVMYFMVTEVVDGRPKKLKKVENVDGLWRDLYSMVEIDTQEGKAVDYVPASDIDVESHDGFQIGSYKARIYRMNYTVGEAELIVDYEYIRINGALEYGLKVINTVGSNKILCVPDVNPLVYGTKALSELNTEIITSIAGNSFLIQKRKNSFGNVDLYYDTWMGKAYQEGGGTSVYELADVWNNITPIKKYSHFTIPIGLYKNVGNKIEYEDLITNQYYSEEEEKAINSLVDMEKDMYSPVVSVDGINSPLESMTFNLHFRTRDIDTWKIIEDEGVYEAANQKTNLSADFQYCNYFITDYYPYSRYAGQLDFNASFYNYKFFTGATDSGKSFGGVKLDWFNGISTGSSTFSGNTHDGNTFYATKDASGNFNGQVSNGQIFSGSSCQWFGGTLNGTNVSGTSFNGKNFEATLYSDNRIGGTVSDGQTIGGQQVPWATGNLYPISFNGVDVKNGGKTFSGHKYGDNGFVGSYTDESSTFSGSMVPGFKADLISNGTNTIASGSTYDCRYFNSVKTDYFNGSMTLDYYTHKTTIEGSIFDGRAFTVTETNTEGHYTGSTSNNENLSFNEVIGFSGGLQSGVTFTGTTFDGRTFEARRGIYGFTGETTDGQVSFTGQTTSGNFSGSTSTGIEFTGKVSGAINPTFEGNFVTIKPFRGTTGISTISGVGYINGDNFYGDIDNIKTFSGLTNTNDSFYGKSEDGLVSGHFFDNAFSNNKSLYFTGNVNNDGISGFFFGLNTYTGTTSENAAFSAYIDKSNNIRGRFITQSPITNIDYDFTATTHTSSGFGGTKYDENVFTGRINNDYITFYGDTFEGRLLPGFAGHSLENDGLFYNGTTFNGVNFSVYKIKPVYSNKNVYYELGYVGKTNDGKIDLMASPLNDGKFSGTTSNGLVFFGSGNASIFSGSFYNYGQFSGSTNNNIQYEGVLNKDGSFSADGTVFKSFTGYTSNVGRFYCTANTLYNVVSGDFFEKKAFSGTTDNDMKFYGSLESDNTLSGGLVGLMPFSGNTTDGIHFSGSRSESTGDFNIEIDGAGTYSGTTNTNSGSINGIVYGLLNPQKFGKLIECSDLLGFLYFTTDDVKNSREKLRKSFLRLTFFDSKNPETQNMLGTSTLYFNCNRYLDTLYTNHDGYHYELTAKSTQFDRTEGSTPDSNADKIDWQFDNAPTVLSECFVIPETLDVNNASSYLYVGDENLKLDSRIRVTGRNSSNESSEGFYAYILKAFADKNEDKTIYMKAEFFHAGLGLKIPMVVPTMGESDESGNISYKAIRDDEWSTISIEEFKNGYELNSVFERLYIPINIRYSKRDRKFVYSIGNDNGYSDTITKDNNKWVFNLFELKIKP